MLRSLVQNRRWKHDGARLRKEAKLEGRRKASVEPPVAAKRPFQRTKHGCTWYDPYHWMRTNREEAIGYLELENSYADACMSHTTSLQRRLEADMARRLSEEISSPPEQIGPWIYYTRIPKGQEYPVFCRKRVTSNTHSSWKKFVTAMVGWNAPEEEEEILLDQNALAEQFGYVQLGTCRLSKNHTTLAYTLDTSGDEVFSLFVKDLRTPGEKSEKQRYGVRSVEWAADGKTLYYTVADNLLRPWRIYRRYLGSSSDDQLVFEEKNSSSFLDVSRTKDWRFITVNVNSKTTSEVYLADAYNSSADLQLVEEREEGVQYFVEHHEEFLYCLTNRGNSGSEYGLVRCPVQGPDFRRWEEVVTMEKGACIEDMEIFEKHLVLYERRNGLPHIEVLDLPLEGLESRRTLSLPQGVCTVIPGANEDFHSSKFRLSLSSPTLPEVFLEYDLKEKKARLLQQEEVLVGHVQQQGASGKFEPEKGKRVKGLNVDPDGSLAGTTPEQCWNSPHCLDSLFMDLSSLYTCQRLNVVSEDAELVPLTVIHRNQFRQDGSGPALLIGYGAYGECLEPEWCNEHLTLLDRGWVIALAHVRGGGELGRTWYRAGQRLTKKNSFRDFIACANFLVEKGYAHAERLTAFGVSAGGLLVAGAVISHPTLFRAVILQVPFLDISNTLLDKELPLSVHEYDEWGDPEDPEHFANIRSYSPYDNIKEAESYPAMLLKIGFLDSRVGYWEAAKWVARMRDVKASKPVLLKSSMETGHLADSSRFGRLKDVAYDYAFLIDMVEAKV